jgi:microcystin-dependent protein
MPYNVNYTDSQNKTPITVFDNTSNTDTSLTFPGRNVTGYGQTIAENFLRLLENFASAAAPVNPTEGQIWFNNDPQIGQLLIWDGSDWKAASGVQKSPVQPGVDQSKVGELWVDTVNQQLYVFSGTDWILVGPNFSTGLRSGLIVEQIEDSSDVIRVVLSIYVEDRPIIIISKDSFTPKKIIPQFPTIRAGITIADPNPNIFSETEIYQGGFLPKIFGTSTSSDGLEIGGATIPASRFLRSDIINTVEQPINIRSDSGIFLGIDGTFNISNSATSAKIYNSSAGSAIDFQVNDSGIPSTVLRIINGKVGINSVSPTESLEVDGNTKINGQLIITDTTATTNLGNGSLRVAGGVAISKNLLVGDTLRIEGETFSSDITPQISDRFELGKSNRRWNVIHTKALFAETISGVLSGSISGNAGTATSLQQQTTFAITGDITAPSFQFNGITGGLTKTFSTSISPGFITSKPRIEELTPPNKNYSESPDTVLTFRPSLSGLYQVTRDTFVGDLGLPLGAILPYAGLQPPPGFLFCDGSEVLRDKYPDLFNVIGSLYDGIAPLLGAPGSTFRLPDLRGRFSLGRDNMDNGEQVLNVLGTPVDGGGGNADRVNGVDADTLGGTGGNDGYILSTSNLPNHQHPLVGSSGTQFFATRVATGVPPDAGAVLGPGGTTPGQSQQLPRTGGVEGLTNQPYPVMNPFLTINYIIRSGRSAF